MTATATPLFLLGDTLRSGGTEGQFVEVAIGLDRSRWDVDVACLDARGELRARLDGAGVPAWSCGPGSFRSVRALVAVVRLARRLRSRGVRIVHCFDFYSSAFGVPAARLAGVPVVIASQRELGDLRRRAERAVYTAMRLLATDVAVNAEAVAARLRRTRGGSGKVRVIQNGVDLVRFSPAVGRDAPRRVIGTLANLRPEKGLDDLVRASVLVRDVRPDVRLEVWGEGSERWEIEQLIKTLGLDATVRLAGPTSTPEDVLRTFDVFVLPSVSEACSNVLLEAMATGLPVVATNVGGTPAVIESGVDGLLVPPRDPAALAKAVVDLIEHPAMAARLGANARRRAESDFAIPRMLERLDALYEDALARAGGRLHERESRRASTRVGSAGSSEAGERGASGIRPLAGWRSGGR